MRAKVTKLIVMSVLGCLTLSAIGQELLRVLPEQRSIHVRPVESLAPAPIPAIGPPNTISETTKLQTFGLSLDDAIRMALENAKVVRFLSGVAASTSGRTLYDVAISNTNIDQNNAVFDPVFNFGVTGSKSDQGSAALDPLNPGQSLILGSSTDSITTNVGVNKKTFSGADWGLNVNSIGSWFEPGTFPLDPQYRTAVELTLRQPLMRGYGRQANLAPVVVARIDTERSYFQYKDSVQELVRGVITAYWNLVAARIEVWAREQQVKQAEFAYERALARRQAEFARAADVAQARSALANFRANLIGARASLLLSETALRNILGLPPDFQTQIVPTSAPIRQRVELDWNRMLELAERHRPDIVELKLVLEADCQLLQQADNFAKPQLDGVASYRWDGLSGTMPNGNRLQSGPGQFAGFNLGVNFSVPVSLRQSRAALRQRELILARDRANLEQGIHQMVHALTINYRNLSQFYEQLIAFREARDAARINYENQVEEFRVGRRDFLNVLQAITDWGNAISQEARAVTQYNTELANIERQTGTILETHGITFYEERFQSLGPIGRLGIIRSDECYPARMPATGGNDRYQDSGAPAEEAFQLEELKRPAPDRNVPGVDRPPLEQPTQPRSSPNFRQ